MNLPLRFLLGVGWFMLTFGLPAQETGVRPEEDEPEQFMELVRVTGYHVKRVDTEGPAPVISFDGLELEEAGITTLEEAARYLTINVPLNYRNGDAVGGSFFDLRGIGTGATLTLVNGLRIAPYAQAEAPVVDINSIPVSAIERIEILKDGASPIYGADAIAGVVNIILKSDYDGIEASAGYEVSEYGDAEGLLADLVAGRSSERGSVLFSLSYYRRDPVPQRDRDWLSDADYTALGGPNLRSGRSSPGSLLRYDTFMWEPDPACGTDPLQTNIGDSLWGPDFGTACRYNYHHAAGLLTGIERWGATVSGRYRLSPRLSFFGDFFYSDLEGENNQAPAPVQGSAQVPTFTGMPYVPADHPNNPFGVDGELAYRPLDLGARTFVTQTDAWRLVLGLEGAWGGWDWRASVLGSENGVDTVYLNMVRQSRLQLALLGMGGEGGNLWYNPFGFEPQNSPEIQDWLTTNSLATNTSREKSAELLVERFFGDLPGGPIGLAVGIQYRDQSLDQWADENLRSGDLAGGEVGLPVNGDREIFSAYAEFSLPLTAALEAQLAARYERYSDFGSTSNPKVALRWQPLDALMLRGSWSTSFLAPTFFQLHAPPTDWLYFLKDTVRCGYTGLPEDCGRREYPGVDQGNPDLGPEEGESWFAGLVWEPEFLPGSQLQLDFWKFMHTERIAWYHPQAVLDAGDDFGIRREPDEPDGTPGRITSVTATMVNSEEFQTRGIDTTLLYGWETASAGYFKASLMHTYVDEYLWMVSRYGDEGVNYAGKIAYQPIPKHRFNLNFNWGLGFHSAAANLHYMGEFEYPEGVWVDGEETEQPWIVSDRTILGLQYSYEFERLKGGRLRLGCTNCTGAVPQEMFGYINPFIDVRGRMVYVRWQQPFH